MMMMKGKLLVSGLARYNKLGVFDLTKLTQASFLLSVGSSMFLPVHDHGVQCGFSELIRTPSKAHGAVTLLPLTHGTALLNRIQGRASRR